MRVLKIILQWFLSSQIRLSQLFDRILPSRYKIDGNMDYINSLVPAHVRPDMLVYDVGGGKTPFFSGETKKRLQLRITGIDIDADELSRAPSGIYDEVVCHDITTYRGRGDGDVIVCMALLEHVRDVSAALQSLHSILKPGGKALLFVPARNALYARLNLLLPQEFKRKLLFQLFPGARRNQGFPAFYDRCTPRDFQRMAAETGFSVSEQHVYYMSTYFSIFFPAHVFWRVWIVLFSLFNREQAAETFTMVLEKK